MKPLILVSIILMEENFILVFFNGRWNLYLSIILMEENFYLRMFLMEYETYILVSIILKTMYNCTTINMTGSVQTCD